MTHGPAGVAVAPASGKAYAAFPDLGIVKIVTRDGRVVAVPTGADVKSLTLDPATGRVYAMNRGPGTISVIDPASDTVVRTLAAPRGSVTALDPERSLLYVAASTGTDPSVIDLVTGRTTALAAGTEAHSLSVDPATHAVYLVGYEDPFLTILDGATLRARRLTLPGWHQWECAFDARRRLLYLASPNDDALVAIDVDHDRIATLPAGASPVAVAVNQQTGRVFVVNYGSSDVSVFAAGAAQPTARIGVGLWPQQLAIDERRNRVFVVNTHAASVSVIDGATDRVVATVATAPAPWAVAVDPGTGRAYVASRIGDRVTVIDADRGTSVQR